MIRAVIVFVILLVILLLVAVNSAGTDQPETTASNAASNYIPTFLVTAAAPLKSNKITYGKEIYPTAAYAKQNYNYDIKCPTFQGAQNNDFDQLEGMWFKLEAVPELMIRLVCSVTTFQLTSRYTMKMIDRVPELNLKCHNDGSEIFSGDSKKVHQSAMLLQMDTTSKTWLSTVLVSDYVHEGGYFLMHRCNVNNPHEQLIEIYSRTKHLDQSIIDSLHQFLISNGMSNLESLIAVIPQDLRFCQNCLNTYIINKYNY